MKKDEPPKLSNGKLLSVAIQSAEDKARFNAILDAEHYLGARQPSGNTVYQVIRDEAGVWVAIALWCGACYRLDPRDTHIGWDMRKREERLGLVVQLARFALVGSGHEINMASRALGCAMRGIGAHYRDAYGYEPALAESFSDPELHFGTVYRATNWEKLGLTKGFTRDYRDFYAHNGKPKVLWAAWLRKDGLQSLTATVLPEKDTPALMPSQVLPFGDAAVESLFGALLGLGDGRRDNRSVSQAAVLAAVVLAQMCGRTTVSEIVRFAQGLTQAQKLLLGFPRCKKNRSICVAPSRKTFDTVLQKVSPSRLAAALDAFFAKSLGGLPETLAVDGKYVRDKAGTLNVCDVHGRTLSSAPIKKKGRSPRSRARPSGGSGTSAAPS
jgi:hypothetical protein